MEADCSNMENGDDPPSLQFFHQWNASDPKPQESSPALPAQPETPNDGHLAGLLTYASMNLKRLPGSSRPFTPKSGAKWGPSQWHVAQVLSEYSCGAVADSHRASHYQMEEVIEDERGRVKSESNST